METPEVWGYSKASELALIIAMSSPVSFPHSRYIEAGVVYRIFRRLS